MRAWRIYFRLGLVGLGILVALAWLLAMFGSGVATLLALDLTFLWLVACIAIGLILLVITLVRRVAKYASARAV